METNEAALRAKRNLTLLASEIQRASIETLKAGLALLESLRAFVTGEMMARYCFIKELKSWGIPDGLASEIVYRIPYRWTLAIVRVLRHDRSKRHVN